MSSQEKTTTSPIKRKESATQTDNQAKKPKPIETSGTTSASTMQTLSITGGLTISENLHTKDDLKIVKGLLDEPYFYPPSTSSFVMQRKISIKEAFPCGLAYREPRPLLKSSGLRWEYQPHPELFKRLRYALTQHYGNFVKGYNGKTVMPIYHFISGAGVGKSRNAAEFPKTAVECLPVEAIELKNRLQDAWVFNVSLENEPHFPQDEPNPFMAIGSRMLLQLLPEKGLKHIIDSYWETDPMTVLKLVAKHKKENLKKATVILIVDGLQNFIVSYYRTLTSIADLGMVGTFLIPCCTATIVGPTIPSQLCHYLPVASLSPPSIRQNDMVTPVFQDDYLTRILVNDCGGHGRVLEVLEMVLRKHDINNCNFSILMTDLRSQLYEIYKEALNIPDKEIDAIARAILTRQRLCPVDHVPGTNRSPRQIAQHGLIRFEPPRSPCDGYLSAPFIWIGMFTDDFGMNKNPVLHNWGFCDYAEHKSKTDRRSTTPGAQLWQHFEHFVASFRVLKSKMYEEGEMVKISEVHTGARLKGDFSFKNHHLDLELASPREDTNSSKHNGDEWIVQCENVDVDVRQCKHCIINGTSASSADSFIALDRSVKSNECLISKLYNTTELTKETYHAERAKSASKDDFFILFTTADNCDFEIPDNSGIVDGAHWNSYFGPFAGRAYSFAIEGALDINSASPSQLDKVHGIDETRANTIIEKRPFSDIEDAKKKSNIPEKVLKRFKFPKSGSN